MKKNLLIFLIFMLIAGFSRAQLVTDFENIPMNVMLGGAADSSMMTVVPNPYSSGINTSYYVTKYVRDKDGVPWGGFWSALPVAVDVTVNKYVHVKVWKPRLSPIKFKLEGGAAGILEIFSMSPQATINQWEDMVFDFSSVTGTYPVVSFMPDFEDPLTLTNDIDIYFDDIIINNDPTPNTVAAYTIEDYEVIPLNYMLGDTNDLSSMTLVANPDPSGINTSAHVIKYLRDMDGVPWGGFWSATGVDVTTNKYMHVKVWKPRISPIKFKIQDGAAGTLEAASMTPQTSTGVWEEMVFDFSSKTGTYPVIAFMPDFEDPLTLTSDMVMYFDDIVLNNDSLSTVAVTMNLNMSYWTGLGIFNPGADFVDVAGSMNGWDGTNSHLTTTNDSIYTITFGNLSAGDTLTFKFRINGSWSDSTCEFPFGGSNRTYITAPGSNIYNAWYNNDSTSAVTFNVNMSIYHLMGLFNPAADFVDIAGSFDGWDGVNHHLTTVDDSIYTITVDSLKFGETIQFKFRINGVWSNVTGEFPFGGLNRTYKVPAGISTYSKYYNDQTIGIVEPQLKGKLQIYPNPVGDFMNITSPVEINKMVITNMVGQQVSVFENLATGIQSLNISNLDKGLYFMTIYQKSGDQLTQKIIKN